MTHSNSGPVILPFHVDPLDGEPDIRVRHVVDVDGVPHQIVVCIWGDESYSATLINLVSGASCPRFGGRPSTGNQSHLRTAQPTASRQ